MNGDSCCKRRKNANRNMSTSTDKGRTETTWEGVGKEPVVKHERELELYRRYEKKK